MKMKLNHLTKANSFRTWCGALVPTVPTGAANAPDCIECRKARDTAVKGHDQSSEGGNVTYAFESDVISLDCTGQQYAASGGYGKAITQ